MGSLSDQANPASPYYGLILPAYQSSKAALNSITISLAKKLADSPIKISSVCPGFVQTGLTRSTETRLRSPPTRPRRLSSGPRPCPTTRPRARSSTRMALSPGSEHRDPVAARLTRPARPLQARTSGELVVAAGWLAGIPADPGAVRTAEGPTAGLPRGRSHPA